MNREQELMTITAEECAEVAIECSKIIRFGVSTDNIERFEKEFGDLLCMYQMLVDDGYLDQTKVAQYANEKQKKLEIYSNLFRKG
jgi:NTP pyrophosphatase (non-canonical NTP hydrolase)